MPVIRNSKELEKAMIEIYKRSIREFTETWCREHPDVSNKDMLRCIDKMEISKLTKDKTITQSIISNVEGLTEELLQDFVNDLKQKTSRH